MNAPTKQHPSERIALAPPSKGTAPRVLTHSTPFKGGELKYYLGTKALLGITCALCLVFFGVEATPQAPTPTLKVATLLKPTQALVDFRLIDSNNKPFTKEQLRGRWHLLFFGYSACPGICPHTLKVLSEAWKIAHLDESLSLTFVSLDPRQDTPQKLKSFLKPFNPYFQGLTGDSSVIQALAKACHVYSWQDPKAPHTLIDHSATLLLINPAAQIHAIFSSPHDATHIAHDLQILLKS